VCKDFTYFAHLHIFHIIYSIKNKDFKELQNMRKVYAQKKLCAYLGSLRIFAYACFQPSNISDIISATDKESAMAPRRIPITEKKLGRANVYGWAYAKPPKIEIDERLRGRFQQEVLLHELLHIALPQLEEECVTKTAEFLSYHTWRFGLRRIQPPAPGPRRQKGTS
jgi:hypothetical protein